MCNTCNGWRHLLQGYYLRISRHTYPVRRCGALKVFDIYIPSVIPNIYPHHTNIDALILTNVISFTEFTPDTFTALLIPTDVTVGKRKFRMMVAAATARYIQLIEFRESATTSRSSSFSNRAHNHKRSQFGDSTTIKSSCAEEMNRAFEVLQPLLV